MAWTPPPPDAPKLVYAFVPRTDADGLERVLTREDWDTLGMRGAQSHDRAARSGRPPPTASCVASTGPNPDPIVFGIFSVFELLLASVYTGVARRAWSRSGPHARRSKKTGAAYSQDADVAGASPIWRSPTTRCPRSSPPCAATSTSATTHGARWFSLLAGVSTAPITTAKSVVDDAMLVAGGSSYFTRAEAQPPLPRRARRDVPPRPGQRTLIATAPGSALWRAEGTVRRTHEGAS